MNLNTFPLFFFHILCVGIHAFFTGLSFIALVQRVLRYMYMYNYICQYCLLLSRASAWLFTCAVSAYGFMPCSEIAISL